MSPGHTIAELGFNCPRVFIKNRGWELWWGVGRREDWVSSDWDPQGEPRALSRKIILSLAHGCAGLLPTAGV